MLNLAHTSFIYSLGGSAKADQVPSYLAFYFYCLPSFHLENQKDIVFLAFPFNAEVPDILLIWLHS